MIAAKALAFASLVFAGVKALDVSTPASVPQCGDVPFTVTGATGNYHFAVVPAEKSCESDALFESEALTDGAYTWKVALKKGTQALVVVDDDSGAEAWSAPFTIGDGDAACLAASSSSSKPASSTTSTVSSTKTNLVINNVIPTSSKSDVTVDTPYNAADKDSTPATGAALTSAQASLFTVLAAMGAVAFAL